MPSTLGRVLVDVVTNKSGGELVKGDVVIVDTSNDHAITTTTTGASTAVIGVVMEWIDINGSGRVQFAGYAGLVNVPASVTRGHYLQTHTVAKQATGNATRRAGSFGQFLTGGATPTAYLFGATDTSTFHGVRAVQSANSNLTNGSLAYVAFDGTDDYDTDAYHDPASSNTRLTVPTGLGGYYHITASALVSADPGRMYCVIRKNGTTLMATGAVYESSSTGASAAAVSCTLNLAQGDYVEFGIKVTANSKAATDAGVAEPSFGMYKVG
jgi:hypothetical protein